MSKYFFSFIFSLATTVAAVHGAQAEEAAVAAGKLFFEHRCRVCHNPQAAAKTYGPSLVGVLGRQAGSLENFGYSDALKRSGIIWTEASLRAWMADNDGMLPGTRMRHVGVSDLAEQEMIVAYLKSLQP